MWDRRVFLKSGAVALFSLGAAGPRFLNRLALAAPPADGRRPKVLVTIFLRGGMDGLMAVPPLDDPSYQKARPSLAVSGARGGAPLLELDERFGLHPSFAPLAPFWAQGSLAIVHAVGSPNPTRSHFDAQDFMETATPWRKGTPSGWLNRLAAEIGTGRSPFGALSMSRDLPRSLYGEEPALALTDLDDFRLRLPDDPIVLGDYQGILERLYERNAQGLIKRRSREMFDALRTLSPKEIEAYRKSRESRYPDTQLGGSLLQIAYLIKANVGLQIACAESVGWDTHVSQGTMRGDFAKRADDLARSIAAFWEDLGPVRDDVVVLTMTEFGRTVEENGSAGTDHGHGSCLFVLGHDVDGGKIYGDFPEQLVPELLFEGRDLPVTTDFRSVFAEVAGKQFQLDDDSWIFPDWTGERLPLLW